MIVHCVLTHANMKLLAVLWLHLALASGQMSSCPSADRIYPCICKVGTDSRPWITCSRIDSSATLVKAVSGLSGLTVSKLHIENSNIGVLPSDFAHNAEILSISISNSNLTKLSEKRNLPPFAGLEDSLQILDIRDSFKQETGALTILSLSHLKRLSSFVSDGNFIPTIGNDWFESGPYGLRDLLISNGKTTSVGSHAFEALDNLRTFTLRGQLEDISRDILPVPAMLLERLDLSSNRLKTIPHDMFSKMPVLEALYLGSNLFTTIDEVVVANVWSKLVYVNFEGNPIQCDSNVKWIYKYRTPENFRGRCAGPPKLRNRDFTSLAISDF